MKNRLDSVNRARLEQEKGAGSYDALAEKLGVNVHYLFYYMVRGHKPTKNTKKGREARDILGIVSQNLISTRNRNEVLRQYAEAKGYKSYSEIGTLILKGYDPVKARDDFIPLHPEQEARNDALKLIRQLKEEENRT